MTDSRMSALTPTELDAEQRRIYEAILSGPRGNAGGVFMNWLRSPGMADPAQRLGEYLRYGTGLPQRLSELAILVVARHWTSQFEWFVHAPIAASAGIADAAIKAIRTGALPSFDEADEQAAYAFSSALIENHEVDDKTYGDTVTALGETGVVELIGVLGYYTLVAMSLRALGETLPGDAPLPLEPLDHCHPRTRD